MDMDKPWAEECWLPGVLSKRQMRKLKETGHLLNIGNFDDAADHSSIDLHLSEEGYKMVRGSIKPCGHNYQVFLSRPYALRMEPDEDGSFTLQKNNCYVFKLKEKLRGSLVDGNIHGQATAKSSLGRLDVIARLIVDGMDEYEGFKPQVLTKSSGDMYLEIAPISFDIRLKPNISLSQLRLFYGAPEQSVIEDNPTLIESILIGREDDQGFLSVDTTPVEIAGLKVSAYRACNETMNKSPIDIWEKKNEEKPNPCDYWVFEESEYDPKMSIYRMRVKNGQFYLLRSKELIALPSSIAVYCRPMDETLGEMRIHYAGFVHPFFGTGRTDRKYGTPLMFEIRGHNVDVSLEDREKLAKLIFYRMSENAEKEYKTGSIFSVEGNYINHVQVVGNQIGEHANPDSFELVVEPDVGNIFNV